MAYTKKAWKDRQTEFPGRRKLSPSGAANVYDVTREEGLEIEPGDALNAANLNALEARIETALTTTDGDLNAHTSDTTKHLTAAERTKWNRDTVHSLSHSKAGTVHKLTGATGLSGLVASQFKAAAPFVTGDTVQVDGVPYAATLSNGEPAEDNLFVSGASVSVILDTAGKKVNFKAGGAANATLPSQSQITVRANGKSGQLVITLTRENSDSFAGTLLTRKTGSAPEKSSDGTKIDIGTALSYTDTGLTDATTYYYRTFAYNAKKQLQTMKTGAIASGSAIIGSRLISLPVGTLVKDSGATYYGVPIVWKIAARNHSGYQFDNVTLITDKIISLKCFDGKEPSNSDGNRQSYGNNRYIYANMRRWLNSSAGAGAWYAAQHSADAPPNGTNAYDNPYDTQAGFLNAFSSEFKNALLTTPLTVARNTVTDGGSYETFSDKIFLASNTEVGLVNENSIAEGAKLALFTDDASRLAYPTAEAVSNSNYAPVILNADCPWDWWLRTPFASDSYEARYVNSGGTLKSYPAYNGEYGVRPLCNLYSDTMINPTPNADGTYSIIL